MWLLWLPPLQLFSIIELFTLLWESSVPLAWPSGGHLQLFGEMPFFFFFHWLLPVKFFLLQTFVETGRTLNRRLWRLFSHLQGGSSAGRGSCSISTWAFCPCVLPWDFRTCFIHLGCTLGRNLGDAEALQGLGAVVPLCCGVYSKFCGSESPTSRFSISLLWPWPRGNEGMVIYNSNTGEFPSSKSAFQESFTANFCR